MIIKVEWISLAFKIKINKSTKLLCSNFSLTKKGQSIESKSKIKFWKPKVNL